MGRKVFFREQVQSFLIVCEGEKTEPLYFEAFRVPGDVRHIDVKGLGRSTDRLVREAIKLKANGDYDQVWVVFDVDQCEPVQVNTAIHLASQNGIEIVISNQAFELWYLLHFNYHDTAIERGQYAAKLSTQIKRQYEKNFPGIYKLLLSRQNNAIQNAKRLLANYVPQNPAKDDPCTTVFKLVEELNRYTPDARRSV